MENDSFFGTMFSFANRRMPDQPQGPYHTAGILLRVLGWFGLVYAAIALVAMLFIIVAITIFGSAVDSMPWGGWWGDWGGAIAAIAVVAILFAMILVAVGSGAVLFWIGWTYDHWRMRDRRALGHFMALGIVLTVFGALGVLGGFASLNAGRLDFVTESIPSLIELGLGITFLVLRGNPHVQEAFGQVPVSPPPQTGPA